MEYRSQRLGIMEIIIIQCACGEILKWRNIQCNLKIEGVSPMFKGLNQGLAVMEMRQDYHLGRELCANQGAG